MTLQKKKGAKNMAKTLKHIAVLAEDGHGFLTELKIRKNFTFEANFASGFVNAMTYSFDDLKENGGKSNMTLEGIECIAKLVDGSIVIVEMEAEFKDVDGNAIEIKKAPKRDSFEQLMRSFMED